MKKLLLSLATASLLAFAAAPVTAAPMAESAPKSVIHVVTVSFKSDAKPEQIKAALDGVKALPAAYKGITRVWTRAIKVQGGKSHAIVMEFADEAALKAYADSPAQKDWYKVYLPIREESTTFDITN
jgi:acyl-CoA reductase-like NAD-dependent aldehyde dehydrogenase